MPRVWEEMNDRELSEYVLFGHLHAAAAAKGLARRAEKAWHLEQARDIGDRLGWRMMRPAGERVCAA